MEAFLTSLGLVALAEIGDKTQLLAILLAARFGRPLPVIAGIFVATIANHFLAALVGHQAAAWLDGAAFRYAIAASFVAMGLWALIPDRFEEDQVSPPRFGALVTTIVAFFLVEMGDKTQLATAALGARFDALAAVTAGTTLGMMVANVPAVLLGKALLARVPIRTVNIGAALLFVMLGAWLAIATWRG